MENQETVTAQREVMVGLWQTGRKDFSVSHKDGLTKEQVDMLKGLKIGDRLKLWTSKESAITNRPSFRLGKLEDRNAQKSNSGNEAGV